MVFDIDLFRKDPKRIRNSQQKRFAAVELVDEVVALDLQRKKARHDLDMLGTQSRQLSKQIETIIKEKVSYCSDIISYDYLKGGCQQDRADKGAQ